MREFVRAFLLQVPLLALSIDFRATWLRRHANFPLTLCSSREQYQNELVQHSYMEYLILRRAMKGRRVNGTAVPDN